MAPVLRKVGEKPIVGYLLRPRLAAIQRARGAVKYTVKRLRGGCAGRRPFTDTEDTVVRTRA